MGRSMRAVAIVGLVCGTAPAAAQEAAGSTVTAASDQSSDIVVTARRREENIEKVPIAIAAISSQQLRQRSIYSENDLQSAVPGLTIRQNGNANQFNYSIRGQTVDTYTNSPPGVLPYIDEAQIVTHNASAFYDLEGIQVLKGPQGTLFGRNTTGGAVLYQTGRVGDRFGGYIDGRYGNYGSRHIEGAVNVPFGGGGLRVAGSYSGGGDYVYNVPTDSHLGALDQKSIRATLKLQPMTGLINTTVVQYTRDRGENTPIEVYSAYACGATNHGITLNTTASCFYSPGSAAFDAFIAAHPDIYPGGVEAVVALQNKLGPWKSLINAPTDHRAHGIFAINTTSWEIAPQITLKNIFSYNRSKSGDNYDYDGTPYPIFQTGGTPAANGLGIVDPLGFYFDTRQVSDEFQLQGKSADGRLTYVAGFYYLDQRDTPDSNVVGFNFAPVSDGVSLRYHQRSTDRSLAGFAQATYKLADRLNLTGGFRYSGDKQTARQEEGSVFGPAFERSSASKPSWTASLDYQLTHSLLAYVTTRGSWRTGGFNYSVTPIDATAADGGNRFGPETTRDVEAGFKYSGSDFGLPITFNADAYVQWVKDIQRAAYVVGVGGTSTVLTVNVPKAKVDGVEADLSVRPAPWLTVGGSGAYTHARYTDGNLAIQGSLQQYGPFADTPRWTGNAYVDLSRPMAADSGTLHLHAEVYAQSKMYFSNTAATISPGTAIPGYALVNGRLSWEKLLGTRMTASVFVRNMLNKRYYAGGNAQGASLGLNTVNPGMPRMFGGELRFEF